MLHLDHPVSYNEKLQWLKLNWRCELANRLMVYKMDMDNEKIVQIQTNFKKHLL